MNTTSIYPQIVLLLSTGIRRGELMGLQWGDVDLDAGKLRIERAVEKTKAHGLRIKTPKTRRRDPDRITQDWKRFTAARGLPRVRLHSLRHSHASGLIAAGVDPVTTSQRLGHASVTTTMSIYAHAFDRNDEAAAKAIDAILKKAAD